VPGEHDVINDDGRGFFTKFNGNADRKWYSFDADGAHFVALVNVLKYKGEHIGALGGEQIAWLKQDLAGLTASTPVVVFAHVPLWSVYPAWGWVTEDSDQAMALLTRFGSVTVLNGHIHQTLQKVEGNVTFHTARSTAFPQPAPGSAPAPGPMKIPEDQARPMLGLREVRYVVGTSPLAVIDTSLA